MRGKRWTCWSPEGFEDLEYRVAVMRLREEGARVVSVGPSPDAASGKNALEARPDAKADEADAAQLERIVIPGGWAPDKLRR